MSGPPLDEDFHVHSAFSDDAASTVAENVAAARARGLRTLCIADHVRRDTAWVPDLVAAVAPYRDAQGSPVRGVPVEGPPVKGGDAGRLRVLAGVEAKILDTAGHLDLPPLPGGIDLVLIADHQFPGEDGPVHPDLVRAAIGSGELTAAEAIERTCAATVGAAYATDRDRVVAHLFSLLPKIGLAEDLISAPLLARLADLLAESGAMVEVNEKWSCPHPRTAAALVRAGVRVVAGSDSHHCRDVGVYRSVRQTADALAPSAASGQAPA